MNTNLTSQIIEIAHQAGMAIMEVYHRDDLGQSSKADNSPLTLADIASNQIIVDSLEKLTPGIPVLSEEAANIPFSKRSKWTRFWLVDPLDGTKEFIKRNGEFTVNIALVENGKPVMGVVYAPVLGVSYFGSIDTGAYVQRSNSAAQTISATNHISSEPIKIVASRSHSDERTTALLKQLGTHECISMGSSLKLCLVAEGAAHLYPRLGPTMEWDTAAAHAVVNAAGGIVCDTSGKELSYNKPDLHNPEFLVLSASDRTLFNLAIACLSSSTVTQ